MPQYSDDGRAIYRFMNDVWVRCPKCDALARVTTVALRDPRFGCSACGYVRVKECRAPEWTIGHGGDPFFGMELWLSTNFRGRLLWFYNPEHMEYVRQYVKAETRTRMPSLRGSANSTMTSRLPLWIKSRKNRLPLLKAIERLDGRVRLAGS